MASPIENFCSELTASWPYTAGSDIPTGWGTAKAVAESAFVFNYYGYKPLFANGRYRSLYTFVRKSESADLRYIYVFANGTHLIAGDASSGSYSYKKISRIYGLSPYSAAKTEVEARFEPYCDSSGNQLCIYESGYYFAVMKEKAQTGVAHRYVTNPSGGFSVKPYQPIESSRFSVLYQEAAGSYSSAYCSITLGDASTVAGWDSVKAKFDSYGGYPSDGYLTTPGEKTTVHGSITNSGHSLPDVSWEITCLAYDRLSKQIEANVDGSKIPAYAGVAPTEDFAKCFKLTYTYGNDYKTLAPQTVQSALDASSIISGAFFEGMTLLFSYSYDGDTIRYADVTIPILSLASNWWAKLDAGQLKIGDKVSLPDVASRIKSQKVIYSNGAEIALSSIEDCSVSVTARAGGEEYEADESFTVYDSEKVYFDVKVSSVSFLSDKTATLEEEAIDRGEDYITSCELAKANSSFTAGTPLSVGDSAEVVFRNSAGKEIKRAKLSDEGVVVAYPEGYGENPAEGLLTDSEHELAITVCPYGQRTMALPWRLTVDYYEKTIIKTSQPSKTQYYIGGSYGTSPTFDPTGMKAKIRKHTNSKGLGTVEDVEIDPSSFSYSAISAEFDGKSTAQAISFSLLIDGQTLTGKVDVVTTKYGIESVSSYGSDSVKYWDNNADKFHEPNGVYLRYAYTDGTESGDISLSGVRYYRKLEDGEPYGELKAGETTIRKSDGSYVYVVPAETDVLGNRIISSFAIDFKKDSIGSVTLGSAITPCVGNKLERIKESTDVLANYESGVTSEVAQSSWYFKKTAAMTSKDAISVVIGTEEFQIPEDKVEWKDPTPGLRYDTSGFPLTYMNKADAIDASKLGVTLVYTDPDGKECDYSEALSYTKETADPAKGLVNVTCDFIPDYVFDGSQKVDVDLTGSDSERKSLRLQAKYRDTLNGATATDSSLSVTVMEIVEITGLSIREPKTSYTVGETFLNESDGTVVRLFYKSSSGAIMTYDANLRDDVTAINVYPVKGTKLSMIQSSRQVTVTAVTNSNIKATYDISVSARSSEASPTTHSLSAVKMEWGGLSNRYFLVEKSDTEIGSDGSRAIKPGTDMDKLQVFGYLADVNDPTKSARVVLFEDWFPPVDGSNNITVTYPCHVSGNADIVNKSHFGILFGNNNARNRLFISGNPDYPNKDWRSGEADSDAFDDEAMASGSFAYFEDTSYATYGETDNAIVGYDIVANDKLLVLKGKSDKETTVYFRTPTTVTAINGSGTAVTGLDGETLYQEEFALSKGNNSVAGVSPKGILNFNGDSLFISSDKQLMGLDLTGIVGDNQRYANSRSYYIDEDLRREDLEDAFLWSDNRYLFLTLKDKAYVAHFEMKSDSQYEWWPIDVSGVSAYLKIGETIYFGTSDGRLSRFSDDRYYDVTKAFAGVGDAKVTEFDGTERIQVSREAMSKIDADEIASGKSYWLKVMSQKGVTDENSSIYYRWATAANSSSVDCDFQFASKSAGGSDILKLVCRSGGKTDLSRIEEIQRTISDEIPVYLHQRGDGGTEIDGFPSSPLKKAYGVPYYLRKVDPEDEGADSICYKLFDSDGNAAMVSTLYGFTMCRRVDLAKVTNPDYSACTFQLSLDGKTLDLVRYHNQSVVNAFVAEIREYSPVEAFMITKPYSMGKLDYLKTIWSVTLTNDTDMPSEMELCVASNKNMVESLKSIAKVSKDALGYDMGETNFESIDFERTVVPRTYTRSRVISNVKFASFGIRNLSGTNCVLSSMSLTYTIPYHSYGD